METSCRVCQRDDGARTIDVATCSEASQLPISLMLSYCAQIEVSDGEQICSECLMNLETAFNFRKQCRQTRTQVTPQVRAKSKKLFQCCVASCARTANSLRKLVLHSTTWHIMERDSNTVQHRTKAISTSCPICCMGFGSVDAMKNHSETLNVQWTKLKCDKCQMICQNTVKYAEHRVERCTGVPAEANVDDNIMECDAEDTSDLDVKMKRAMEIVKTGKRFMMKLLESELYTLTETNYAPKALLEELLASFKKTSKIVYVCETCGFKSFQKCYLLQHIATSQDCQSFYNALGSFDPMQAEPWFSCVTCQFVAANPIAMMQHQSKTNHSRIKTVPPQSAKVSNMVKCIEIDKQKLIASNTINSANEIKDATQIATKVETVESSGLPVTQPVSEPLKQHHDDPLNLKCKCGQTFTRNTLLQRHIRQFCLLKFGRKLSPLHRKAVVIKGVKNVLQCDGCLITLISPSDVARHQQISCPAYKQQRLAERSRVGSAKK